MNRVASAPSCSAFIHRVALEEVSGHWYKDESDRVSAFKDLSLGGRGGGRLVNR